MKWQTLEVDGQREYAAVVPGGILQVSPTHKRGTWEAWHEPDGGVARQIAVIEKGGPTAAKQAAERYKANMEHFPDEFHILTARDMRDMGMAVLPPGEVAVMSPKGSVRFRSRRGAKAAVDRLNERYAQAMAEMAEQRRSPRPRRSPPVEKKREGFKYEASWAFRSRSGKIKIYKRGFNSKKRARDRVKLAMREEGAVSGIVEHTDPWVKEMTVYEKGGFWEDAAAWARQEYGGR